MITEDKIFFHYENISKKQPITADIFLTNYCNNNCKYCSYHRWELRQDKKSMTFDEFKRNINILKEAGVKGYILTGGGEPSICKDFDKITEWLETQQIPYGINTNFNVLKLIKPIFLKVSLDCYDEKSYKKTRGVDKYKTVISNIKQYTEWKNANNVTTKLVIQCVADSTEKVKKLYKAIKNLDIQEIIYRPIESTDGEYYKNPTSIKNANAIINCIKKLQEKDSRVCINYKFFYLNSHFKECHANLLQIALNESSEVIYCCHKPYEIIGHITDKDIFEKRQKARTNMRSCDIPCRLSGANKQILKLNTKPIDANFI